MWAGIAGGCKGRGIEREGKERREGMMWISGALDPLRLFPSQLHGLTPGVIPSLLFYIHFL